MSGRIGLLLAATIAYAVAAAPQDRSMRRFEPGRMADLETRMWQAYYAKQRTRLFLLLVSTLREQYRYSWATATRQAFYFARAAAAFGDITLDYEQVVPDLEKGYQAGSN